MTPSLVTIPNVPLVGTGLEYELMTGDWTVTEDDLASIVGSQDDPAIVSPRLKLSSGGVHGTAINEPAFGIAANLRLGDNGQTVYCDYVGVPAWLAELLPVAYPNRSIEAQGFDTVTGHKWPVVVTAVELLGVTWPGISTLADLPLYYGDQVPAEVEVAAALSTVRADEPLESKGAGVGDDLSDRQLSIAASVNVDDVRRDYYDTLNSDQSWWWIRAIYLDPNELIVDDDEGALYRVPFTVKGDQVEFGDPIEVKIEYVDTPKKVAAAIASAAIAQVHDQETTTVYASRAEARPEIKGGKMDPKKLRESLGLEEDATDAEVEAKLAQARESGGGSEEPNPGDEGQEGVPADEEGEQPAPAEPAPEPEAVAVSKEVESIDTATLANLRRDAALGAEARKQQIDAEDAAELKAAVEQGKIPPARKDHYAKLLKVDREGTRELLASLAAGVIPVEERGTAPDEAGTDNSTHEAIMASFGVERKVA